MSEPFFMKCECGGELYYDDRNPLDKYWVCRTCGRAWIPLQHVDRYAAALGIAIETLEEIAEIQAPALANGTPGIGFEQATKALEQIRGEK